MNGQKTSSTTPHNPLLPLDDVVVANQAVGIVTVFGSKMRNTPGTSAAVYGKMGQAGINIIASAQGGEELSISLVVSAEDVDEAYLRLGSM